MNDPGAQLAWYVARGSGVVAYLLLTLAVCLGIAVSRRWRADRVPRLVVHNVHRSTTLIFYLFVLVHVGAVLSDPRIGAGLIDLLVPLVSEYHRFQMALGIIAAELALAVGASVFVRRWIGYRGWHAIHACSYLIFVAAFAHGVTAGSDTRTSWAIALYAGSAVFVLAALGWRLADVPAISSDSLIGVIDTVRSRRRAARSIVAGEIAPSTAHAQFVGGDSNQSV